MTGDTITDLPSTYNPLLGRIAVLRT